MPSQGTGRVEQSDALGNLAHSTINYFIVTNAKKYIYHEIGNIWSKQRKEKHTV